MFWERMRAVVERMDGQRNWEMMEETLGGSVMEKVTSQLKREKYDRRCRWGQERGREKDKDDDEDGGRRRS